MGFHFPISEIHINLWSLSKNILVKPRVRSQAYDRKYFALAATSVRNVLSEDVKRIPSVSLYK